jgi:3',5'-cyclic AMP phosphodiesterase CpdA
MKRVMKSILAVMILLLLGTTPEGAWAAFKGARFAVISDLHYYDSGLGTSGAAFEAYLASDRKMLRESGAILDAAVSAIIAENVDFVLIPGDLTKDGELAGHIGVAQQLARLESQGIQVFVIPGNHDINNPHAVRYLGDSTEPVPTVSPKHFKKLYSKYGFKQSKKRDRQSLSYIVEPVRGLWVLALDSCKYSENEVAGTPVTGGGLSEETLAWVQARLEQARKQKKIVIGFMHHGLLEHFSGQSLLFPEYLLDQWATVAQRLANSGLKVVFTGHFHSQDAVDSTQMPLPLEPSILDIETGSLVTYPSPYRIVSIDSGNVMSVESRTVDAIDFDTGGIPLRDYSRTFTQEGLYMVAQWTLIHQYGLPYGTPEEMGLVDFLAAQIAEAFLAHYAGNEAPDPTTIGFIGSLLGGLPPQPTLGAYLGALWTDPDLLDHDALVILD